MEPVPSHSDTRAETLLIRHCRSFDETRAPAYSRLEQTLGGQLTRLLVPALATRLLRRRDDDVAS
jgi:hypothetical protein